MVLFLQRLICYNDIKALSVGFVVQQEPQELTQQNKHSAAAGNGRQRKKERKET